MDDRRDSGLLPPEQGPSESSSREEEPLPVINVPLVGTSMVPGSLPRSMYPVEHLLLSPRAVALGTTAVLLLFGALLSLPEQAPDFCLSPDRRSDLCYCEAFHDGLIRQPINSLSSIAFPALGLAMLWRTPKIPPRARALFHRDKRLHVLWAVTCIVLGSASAAFHATFLVLTGLFDSLGILAWMSLFTAYHVGRALKWRANRILVASATMTVTLFALSVASLALTSGANGPHRIGEIAAGVAIFSPLLCYARHGFPGWRSEAWLVSGALCIVLARFVLGQSETGGPWCAPHSWLQGHAVFHLLTAAATWLVFEHAQRTSP